MIKLRARKEKRDQSISQYHPPLITDNRTKKKKGNKQEIKASSQIEITNREKRKEKLLLKTEEEKEREI